MSAANSLAKKRRAPPLTPPQMSQQQQPQSSSSGFSQDNGNNGGTSGFTLQQVIAVIDRRLTTLEKTVATNAPQESRQIPQPPQQQQQKPADNTLLMEHINESNARFELLAEEIANLKTIVMNLQSYTMDVNKCLFEERQQQNQNQQMLFGADILTSLAENNKQDPVFPEDDGEEEYDDETAQLPAVANETA